MSASQGEFEGVNEAVQAVSEGVEQCNGRWKVAEKKLYLEFVQNNPELLARNNTRNMKAFKQMATVITTRSPIQCRSHHQKMLQKPYIQEMIYGGEIKLEGKKTEEAKPKCAQVNDETQSEDDPGSQKEQLSLCSIQDFLNADRFGEENLVMVNLAEDEPRNEGTWDLYDHLELLVPYF